MVDLGYHLNVRPSGKGPYVRVDRRLHCGVGLLRRQASASDKEELVVAQPLGQKVRRLPVEPGATHPPHVENTLTPAVGSASPKERAEKLAVDAVRHDRPRHWHA